MVTVRAGSPPAAAPAATRHDATISPDRLPMLDSGARVVPAHCIGRGSDEIAAMLISETLPVGHRPPVGSERDARSRRAIHAKVYGRHDAADRRSDEGTGAHVNRPVAICNDPQHAGGRGNG